MLKIITVWQTKKIQIKFKMSSQVKYAFVNVINLELNDPFLIKYF